MSTPSNIIGSEIVKELVKAGSLFLILSVIIIVLYKKIENYEIRNAQQTKEMKDRLNMLESKFTDCQQNNIEIITKLNIDYITVIEKNNRLLKTLQ